MSTIYLTRESGVVCARIAPEGTKRIDALVISGDWRKLVVCPILQSFVCDIVLEIQIQC